MAGMTAAREESAAGAADRREGRFTSLTISAGTKAELEKLRQDLPDGEVSFDTLLRDMVARVRRAPKLDEERAAEILSRLEALEAEVTMMCTDPGDGRVFRIDAGVVRHGVDGKAGEVRAGGLLSPDVVMHGAYMSTPSKTLLSEHSGNMPAKALDFVRQEAKRIQDARAVVAKSAKD